MPKVPIFIYGNLRHLSVFIHSNSLSCVCAMDTYNSYFTPNTQLSIDEIGQMIEHMMFHSEHGTHPISVVIDAGGLMSAWFAR